MISVTLPPLTVIRTWTGPYRVETVGPVTVLAPAAALGAGVAGRWPSRPASRWSPSPTSRCPCAPTCPTPSRRPPRLRPRRRVVAPIDWSGVLKPNSSRTTTTVPTNAVAARRGITTIDPSPP